MNPGTFRKSVLHGKTNIPQALMNLTPKTPRFRAVSAFFALKNKPKESKAHKTTRTSQPTESKLKNHMFLKVCIGACTVVCAFMEAGGAWLIHQGMAEKSKLAYQLAYAKSDVQAHEILAGIDNAKHSIGNGWFMVAAFAMPLIAGVWGLGISKKITRFLNYVNANQTALAREKLNDLREKGISTSKISDIVSRQRDKEETSL